MFLLCLGHSQLWLLVIIELVNHLISVDRQLLYINTFVNSTVYFLLLFPFQLVYTLTNFRQYAICNLSAPCLYYVKWS